jgi:SAM-dependent methyltransferase
LPRDGEVIALEVIERFRCNRCDEVVDRDRSRDDSSLWCAGGHRYSITSGYIDARTGRIDRTTEKTFASFGFEWTHFSDTQPENQTFWDRYFEDVPTEALAEAVAVDVGCGMARYSRITAARVRHLVAVDGSDAIAAAVRNLSDSGNTTCVRADLRAMPFGRRSFDFVSCLGVLHHLVDPRASFAHVAALVGKGGHLLVYLYSRPSGRGIRQLALTAAKVSRKVTIRVPHPLLRVVCWPAALVLYLVFVTPGAVGARNGYRVLDGLPLNAYRGKPLRALWLDTFDRLSAPVEHRYRWEDVKPWFEEAGLDVLAVREFGGLMITARRPS